MEYAKNVQIGAAHVSKTLLIAQVANRIARYLRYSAQDALKRVLTIISIHLVFVNNVFHLVLPVKVKEIAASNVTEQKAKSTVLDLSA
jgi:hypothetical protein